MEGFEKLFSIEEGDRKMEKIERIELADGIFIDFKWNISKSFEGEKISRSDNEIPIPTFSPYVKKRKKRFHTGWLSDVDLMKMKELYEDKRSDSYIANQFGCSYTTIGKIRRRNFRRRS